MAIEISLGKFFFSTDRLHLNKPVSEPAYIKDLRGHKGLFDFYGISLDSLNPDPDSRVTELKTKDGPMRIFWKERVVVPPEGYYKNNLVYVPDTLGNSKMAEDESNG